MPAPANAADDMAEMERVAAEAGKNGNIYAIEVSRRLREGGRRKMTIDLPPLDTHADVDRAQVAAILAVARGDADPRDAACLSGMLDNLRRALATRDLEERLRALEKANAEEAAKAKKR
jgi:hypothetical protein